MLFFRKVNEEAKTRQASLRLVPRSLEVDESGKSPRALLEETKMPSCPSIHDVVRTGHYIVTISVSGTHHPNH